MPNDEGQVGIGEVQVPDYLRPTYANFVLVNSTPWDFRLVFAIVKSPLPGAEAEQAQATRALRPEAVAEIIIPANLMAAFMTALKQNFDKYLEQFGVPGMDPMGPGQGEE